MVDADGRVRVMDFGLARAGREPQPRDPVLEPAIGAHTSTLTLDVTRAGALMGTPRYMAPEQFGGGEVSAAADQFAFCVTLWELLFSARPFGGDTIIELATNVTAGDRAPVPRGAGVPLWLRRVCDRGLALEPGRRFSSLDELLRALSSGQRTATRRRAVAAVAALAAVGLGAEGYRRYDVAQTVKACAETGRAIDVIWDDAARQRVAQAVRDTGVAYAESTIEKTLPLLDEYAAGWREAREETCLAHKVDERWSPETMDRALWCLDERTRDLSAMIGALSRADPMMVQRAVVATTAMARADQCLDENRLRLRGVPPPDQRDVIHEVQELLARAKALYRVARYDTATELLEEALPRARALAWGPLLASALLRDGELKESRGEYDAAAASLREAYLVASASGSPRHAIGAASQLVFVVGYRMAAPPAELFWDRLAVIELDRIDAPADDPLRLGLRNNIAASAASAGDFLRARRLFEQNLEAYTRTFGERHLTVARTLDHIGNAATELGDHAKSEEMLRLALEIYGERLGQSHPDLASATNNLAIALERSGNYDDALVYNRRSLSILEKTFGPDHPNFGVGLNNLGLSLVGAAQYAEAREMFERALTIWREKLGPDHPHVGLVTDNIGITYLRAGDLEKARETHARALAHRERVLGPDHTSVANSLRNLAGAIRRLDDPAGARPLYERALAILERNVGPDNPRVADPLVGLSLVARAEGRTQDAVALAERALPLLESSGDAPPENLALARFALASGLYAAGREQARAIALGRQAEATLREVKGREQERNDVTRWLEAHAGP